MHLSEKSYGEDIVSSSREILEKFIRELRINKAKYVKITFDGDTLNIFLLINNDLKKAANAVFNPRNAMHISRNDGLMEGMFNHKKDVMVLTNALINTTKGYTPEEERLFEICRNWKEPV